MGNQDGASGSLPAGAAGRASGGCILSRSRVETRPRIVAGPHFLRSFAIPMVHSGSMKMAMIAIAMMR